MSASNLPPPTLPIVGPDGRVNQVWWRYFLTLFDRTGGAGGDTGTLDTLFAMMPTPEAAPMAAVIEVAALAQRSLQGQIDALRGEVEALRSQTANSRPNASQAPSAGEIYTFMRR